jgi:hypothetical protein
MVVAIIERSFLPLSSSAGLRPPRAARIRAGMVMSHVLIILHVLLISYQHALIISHALIASGALIA